MDVLKCQVLFSPHFFVSLVLVFLWRVYLLCFENCTRTGVLPHTHYLVRLYNP